MSTTVAFDDGGVGLAEGMPVGRRNAHIPEDESQSDLVAKRQAQEEGVKHACTRDLFLSQEAAGDVQRQHGRRRDGARQAQYAVPVRRTGSMGPSVGTGDISKPHRRREVFLPRGAPGFSKSPEERSRDGDRGRLSPSDEYRVLRCPQTDSPMPSWPRPTVRWST